MVTDLSQTNSLINQVVSELRDEHIQQDPSRFRRNLEKIGELMAYEISKTLAYELRETKTSLGIANQYVLKDYPVLATILRAGLPMHQGLLNMFDRSESAFITAYRKYKKNEAFQIQLEYISCPDLQDRVLILSDPMLATGQSSLKAYRGLLEYGKPSHTHIVSVVASVEGLNYLKRNLSADEVSLWIGAIDEELTARAYIVPGLGDAGDLAYGKKTEISLDR